MFVAQTLLLLASSFGTIIAVGCLLVYLDDRLSSPDPSGVGSVRGAPYESRRGPLLRRLRPHVPGLAAVTTRELRYEPPLFTARDAVSAPSQYRSTKRG